MLNLDWTELALIAVVAMVVIRPKDLPDAVRSVAEGIRKLRRMAGEFQGQLDEVVREAKLEDVRNQINEIRSFDFRGAMERELDKDGSIRKTFSEDPIGNPLKDAFQDRPATAYGAEVTPPPAATAAPEPPPAIPPSAPAFVPPGVAAATPPPPPLASPTPGPAPAAATPPPPVPAPAPGGPVGAA